MSITRQIDALKAGKLPDEFSLSWSERSCRHLAIGAFLVRESLVEGLSHGERRASETLTEIRALDAVHVTLMQ